MSVGYIEVLCLNRKCLYVFQAAEEIKKLYQLFLKVDATQIEINPLGETKDGRGMIKVYFTNL